jgi:hypothetical protein
MLFFNRDNQEKIFLNYLPKGRILKQARMQGTNFNKLIKWIASGFEWLIDTYNIYFKGLYICESKFFIENFKKDYSVPNEIFYQTTNEEHQADIKVLKYLMWGNTTWHFKKIAQMYGICVGVKNGVDYFQNSRIPNKIPHKLFSDFGNTNHLLVVTIYQQDTDILPHTIPHKLGAGLKLEKIKKIYDKIKPSHTKILYLQGDYEIEVTTTTDILPHSVPHRLGNIIETKIIYKEQEQCEQSEICVKGL